MAIITSSIGSGPGRDFSTIGAWVASIPTDVVASGNIYVGELYNDSEFVENVDISSSFNTDADHYIQIDAAPGQSFRDHVDAATLPLTYDASKGVAIRSNSDYTIAVKFDADFTKSNGIQFNGAGTSTQGFSAAGSNVSVTNFIATGKWRAFVTDGPNAYLRNFVIYSGASDDALWLVGANPSVMNGTVVSTSGSGLRGIKAEYSTPEVRNVVAAGFSTCFDTSTGSFTGSNNASTDGTAPGSSSLTSLTIGDVFENPVSDFRLKAGSPLIDAGGTYGLPTDIVGVTRPIGVAYDIGAREYGEPGPPPDPPTATVTDQSVPDGQTVTITLETTDATSGTITFTGSDGGETRAVPFAVEDDAAVVVAEGLAPGHYELSGEVTGPGGTDDVSGLAAFDIVPVSGGGEIDLGGGGDDGGGIGFIEEIKFIGFIS